MIYDIDSLRQSCSKGRKFDFLFFWGHTQQGEQVDKSCLSQWWKSPFVIEGSRYSCAEQYMMAEKARLFHDEASLATILRTDNPKVMKEFGRRVSGFDGQVWEDRCYGIVKQANEAKFSQHPELGNFLKATGERIIVEASPYDRIWGIGLMQDDPKAKDPLQWRGTNLLGFALMEVRDILLGRKEVTK